MNSHAASALLPDLAIVIVNWNSGELLARCVASISDALVGGVAVTEIVIVDNNSTDGSADDVCLSGLPINVKLIRNICNVGFASACNIGARATTAQILLFLNPDIELNASSLAAPMRFLAADRARQGGIVGIQLLDIDGHVHSSCARFPTPTRMVGLAIGLDRLVPWLVRPHFMLEWGHDETRVVDQVMGAFLMMRRADFDRLSGFDQVFFLYMEDVDLALRAKKAGLDSVYLHCATAMHIGGGTTRRHKAARLVYVLRSRILFARKHFGPVGRAAVVLAMLALEPAARIVRSFLSGQIGETRNVLAATKWLWRHYPFHARGDKGGAEL